MRAGTQTIALVAALTAAALALGCGADGGSSHTGADADGGSSHLDAAADGAGENADSSGSSGAADGGGVDANAPCTMPTSWGPALRKMSALELLAKGVGCDLTGDGKPENAMGALQAMAGNAIKHSVSSGDVKLILEAVPWKTDGSPIDLRMLSADVDDSNADCKFNEQVCKYTIGAVNYDKDGPKNGACPTTTSMKGATIGGGKLVGGGKDHSFVIPIPITNFKLEIPFVRARIEASVTDDTAWKSTKDGRLCGAIPQKSLHEALEKLPDKDLAALGGKDAVKGILDGLLKPDIDLDGDGTPEAISAGFAFETIGAEVVGITPEK